MIDRYFAQIEKLLQSFSDITSYEIIKKSYNSEQGLISGTITYLNNSQLEFMEVIDMGIPLKLKYRYHFMDEQKNIIFRYDNAPHHKDLKSFPNHKHTVTNILECTEPLLVDVLSEIAGIMQ